MEDKFESVETITESEETENENTDTPVAENEPDVEPPVLGDIPPSESVDVDIQVTDGDAPTHSTSPGDVSEGDVSMGDVSTGDISGGDAVPGDKTSRTASPTAGTSALQVEVTCTCSCGDVVPLWDSDIADYSTTDGLLLLILIVAAVNTFLAARRKK